MSEPKIYSRNFIDENATVTVSSGSGFSANLNDRNRDSQWISSGENSDATEISVIAILNSAGDETEFEFDRVVVINHNLKDIAIDYWNGTAWVEWETAAAVAVPHSILTESAQTTSRIRLRASATQTTNQEKRIGQLVVCKTTIEFSDLQELSSYSVSFRQEITEVKLGDGSIHRTVIKDSLKYQARVQISFLSTAQLESLRVLRASGAAFLWQPESVSRIDELYYVTWAGDFTWEYVTTYKGAGVRINMLLKEV